MAAVTRCLNSGAVKRSTSPLTAITCVCGSWRRSSISNSMAIAVRDRSHTRGIRNLRRYEGLGNLGAAVAVGQAYVEELARLGTSGRDLHRVRELLDHVAHAGHRRVDDQRLAAAVAQRTDAQGEPALPGLEGDLDALGRDVRGRACGDQVGH